MDAEVSTLLSTVVALLIRGTVVALLIRGTVVTLLLIRGVSFNSIRLYRFKHRIEAMSINQWNQYMICMTYSTRAPSSIS
jgi:hypothetical protein